MGGSKTSMNLARTALHCQSSRPGETVRREMVNPADGRTREVRAFPIRDLSGKVSMVVEYVQDITDRKRAESELRDAYEQIAATEEELRDITRNWQHSEQRIRESEAKFRAIIDQSFQFIGLMNTDGTLIEANRSALAFAGISESDVINRPFWETPWWSHSADLQEMLKDAIQRAASGETVRFEATHPAADGHLAYIDFSIKPMVDSTGRILYLIPEGRDITERKQAEEKLRTAYGQLSATEEELRQQYEELAPERRKAPGK